MLYSIGVQVKVIFAYVFYNIYNIVFDLYS